MDSSHIAIITLTDKSQTLKELKHTLEEEKRVLEARIQQASTHIRQLNEVIAQLQQPVNREPIPGKPKVFGSTVNIAAATKTKTTVPAHYPENGSLRKKVLFALKELNRFASTRDLAAYIVDKEPNEHIENIIEQISKQLARYKKRGDIVSREDEATRFTLYGLPK